MEKPWLTRYPDDVPELINPDQYESLVDMFEQSVRNYADQAAFVNMGTVMTFRKLEERSRAFAAYLQNELKLKKGARVALMMPNLLQYPVALFGVLRAGLIAVNVNPLYTPRRARASIERCRCHDHCHCVELCQHLRKSRAQYTSKERGDHQFRTNVTACKRNLGRFCGEIRQRHGTQV